MLFVGVATAQAPEQPDPTGRLGTQVEDVGLPGAGRVALGFLVTVALALGAAVVLKRAGMLQRAWPAVFKRRMGESRIRPLDRQPISATITIHLVEVDGTRVLIAEGRGSMAITVMPGGDVRAPTTTDVGSSP